MRCLIISYSDFEEKNNSCGFNWVVIFIVKLKERFNYSQL